AKQDVVYASLDPSGPQHLLAKWLQTQPLACAITHSEALCATKQKGRQGGDKRTVNNPEEQEQNGTVGISSWIMRNDHCVLQAPQQRGSVHQSEPQFTIAFGTHANNQRIFLQLQ
ncbi:hypothetical protein CHARACLAT_020428, partial [Characodon lateralis]|nr:hypothetical protein [Characodon lateralis]